jgi:hypothetical protein
MVLRRNPLPSTWTLCCRSMSGLLRGAGSPSPVPNVRVKSESGSRESTEPSEKPSKRSCFNAIGSSNNQGNARQQQGERHEASSNGTQQAAPANEPINLSRFCDLLQDHAQGSVQCKGADSVMLFGSTGVGKSTALHLLAGANFSFEAVELATDESAAADEFGGPDTELQLITQKKIPGCVIGEFFLFGFKYCFWHLCLRMTISTHLMHVACLYCCR